VILRGTRGRRAPLRVSALALTFLAAAWSAGPAAAFKIPCRDWNVTIRVREASAPPRALQFRIDYGDSRGDFVGSRDGVECRNRIDDSLFDANDNEAERWLRTGTISLEDLPYPGPVATCLFREYSGDVPSPDELSLVVEDASDGLIDGIEVSATLRIVSAGDLTECDDRCGDGLVDDRYETCDDGNTRDGDGCDSTCRPPICGDGVVEFPEDCDDGNTSSDDACTGECKPATCGDGFVFAEVEECDDGNRNEDETCPADCGALPQCGSPIADGRVVASDALRILWAAVGRDDECPTWACDVDSSDTVTTSDSLSVLRRAVGQPLNLICAAPSFLQIRLHAPDNVSALEVDIDHAGAAAELVLEGDKPKCESLVEGASMTFEAPMDGMMRLTAALESGFGDRKSIARCAIVPSGPLGARHFPATVLQADSPAGTPVSGVTVRAVPY
jgi:cysteine-rich repeat protein